MSEKLTAETLLERGVKIRIDNVGLLRKIRKSTTFYLYQPFAGTLLAISERALTMRIDEERLQENPLHESWVTVDREIKNTARIIAIAILRRRWKIRLFTGILARYLFWRMTPSKMFELAQVLLQINNTASFLHSIRLIAGQRITLSPQDSGG